MASVLDPEEEHVAALRRLADFGGRRVLEFGCGDGRLTIAMVRDGAQVFAFDSDEDAVERARSALPPDLNGSVEYRAASALSIELDRCSFDLALFSWSL